VADLRAGLVRTGIGDELGGLGRRLAQLEPALDRVEVRVALTQQALVLGAEIERRLERCRRVGIDRLDFEVGPASCPAGYPAGA